MAAPSASNVGLCSTSKDGCADSGSTAASERGADASVRGRRATPRLISEEQMGTLLACIHREDFVLRSARACDGDGACFRLIFTAYAEPCRRGRACD
jgi:hypothetical protein